MTLSAETHLGAYEIISALGAGGMGEVYRARDTKLGRDVALKILPDSFARDPERVARFKREAQVLAALNHPHIAAIYGLEESGGWWAGGSDESQTIDAACRIDGIGDAARAGAGAARLEGARG